MVTRIRQIELAKGDGYKFGPRAAEQEMYKKVRRSVHVNTDVKKGDIITNEMLVVKRPGYGVEPYRKSEIINRVAKVNIPRDHWIDWNMID